MVRPGKLRRYVDLTLLATPLQRVIEYITIASKMQVLAYLDWDRCEFS